MIPHSFDIIGDKEKAVAIVNFSKLKLTKGKKKKVAEELMKKHKNVKSVLELASPRCGTYRTRKYHLLAGSRNTEVIHKESGCRFLVDVRKVYFSQREVAERQRILELVGSNETIMVFFAGVGPFAIVIAKQAKKLIGIEINADAVRYFRENVRLNCLSNVTVEKGDVRRKAKKYYGKCDRVIMPLPENALAYLEQAIKCLKPDGICHFYFFAKEVKGKKKEIKDKAEKMGEKICFVGKQRVLPYSPRIWKYRLDFKVA